MTITTKRSIIALLLSLVLVVSLFTIGISATESEATSATETVTESASVSESTTASETESATVSESESKTESSTTSETAPETESAKVVETRKTLIINGVIIAVIILIIAIIVIKFHKKLGGFLRSVKSELKKIVWSSKENTRKGFLVVAIVAVVTALLLAVIDLAFNTGISRLPGLFK